MGNLRFAQEILIHHILESPRVEFSEGAYETAPLARKAPDFDYHEKDSVDPNILADPMGELYRLQNVSHPAIKPVALIFYCFGILLLLVTTAMRAAVQNSATEAAG